MASPSRATVLRIATLTALAQVVVLNTENVSRPDFLPSGVLNSQSVAGAAELAHERARRASNDGSITCPGDNVPESDCPLGCKRTRLLCTIYASLFEPLSNSRTSGAVSLSEVSRETCAVRCAQLAPDCLHFSHRSYRGQCILGCRQGSRQCRPSGDLVQDSGWTLYFASARRLAAAGRQFLSELAEEANIDNSVISNITGRLAYPGRFGERDIQHEGTHAISQLLAMQKPKQPTTPDGGGEGSVQSMIVNEREPSLPSDCGRVPLKSIIALIPFVVNGRPAAPGQYPWQARILVASGGSLNHHCGGIIITERHVLTAAHCLRNIALNNVEVSVGEVNLNEPSEYRERFALENMFFHENYTKGGQYTNDIMLLRLRLRRRGGILAGITFGDFVQPACLPRAGLRYPPELMCEVSGWGTTSSSSRVSSPTLRAVDVPLVSDQYCGSPEAYGVQFHSDIMVCAGYTDPGRGDSCGGDSGGPLACPLADSDRYAAYGIVSHGHSKGCGEEPGVYTRVEHYQDWILYAIRILR